MGSLVSKRTIFYFQEEAQEQGKEEGSISSQLQGREDADEKEDTTVGSLLGGEYPPLGMCFGVLRG